jgi:Flp pilus assembly protein TadG
MSWRKLLGRLHRDSDGAMVIETALVAPVLVLMSLGAFQISGVIARQTELQSAASEAAAIALASPPDTSAKRATLEQVIEASSGLPTDKVTVAEAFRCDAATSYVTSSSSCAGSQYVGVYVRIDLTDSYTPAWTQFGLGSAINFNVTRYVLIEQVAT